MSDWTTLLIQRLELTAALTSIYHGPQSHYAPATEDSEGCIGGPGSSWEKNRRALLDQYYKIFEVIFFLMGNTFTLTAYIFNVCVPMKRNLSILNIEAICMPCLSYICSMTCQEYVLTWVAGYTSYCSYFSAWYVISIIPATSPVQSILHTTTPPR